MRLWSKDAPAARGRAPVTVGLPCFCRHIHRRPSVRHLSVLKIYYTSPGPTRLCHVTRLQCVVRAIRRACVFFFRAAAFFFLMPLRRAMNAPAARGVAAPMQRQLTRVAPLARRHTSMQHLYRYQKYQALVMARTHVHFPGLDPT